MAQAVALVWRVGGVGDADLFAGLGNNGVPEALQVAVKSADLQQ